MILAKRIIITIPLIYFCLFPIYSTNAGVYKTSDLKIKNSRTEKVTALFMERCIPQKGQSVCECSLLAESNKVRNLRKKRLPRLEKLVVAQRKGLLIVPGMTNTAIDKICRLDDSVTETRWETTLALVDGDNQKFRDLKAHAKNLNKQRREYIKTCISQSPTMGVALKNSKYFKNRTELNMINQDLAQDDGILYPEVSRKLALTFSKIKIRGGHKYYSMVLQGGRKKKCFP